MNSSADEYGIREAINYYIEGMRTGNVEVLRQGFHGQAILCGYLGDEMIAAPIEGLYDWVNSNPAPAATGEAFDCVVLSLEITGRVASAKLCVSNLSCPRLQPLRRTGKNSSVARDSF